jgi:hypothetical protein
MCSQICGEISRIRSSGSSCRSARKLSTARREIGGVPQDDGTHHEVEAGGAESLALEGAVADFAALVEEHRPGICCDRGEARCRHGACWGACSPWRQHMRSRICLSSQPALQRRRTMEYCTHGAHLSTTSRDRNEIADKDLARVWPLQHAQIFPNGTYFLNWAQPSPPRSRPDDAPPRSLA